MSNPLHVPDLFVSLRRRGTVPTSIRFRPRRAGWRIDVIFTGRRYCSCTVTNEFVRDAAEGLAMEAVCGLLDPRKEVRQ